jgi:hypothetical protein
VPIGIAADEPRREAPAGQLALAVARREGDDQAQDAPRLDLLERRGQRLVEILRVVARQVGSSGARWCGIVNSVNAIRLFFAARDFRTRCAAMIWRCAAAVAARRAR